jgi:hypothetical protein
MRTPLQNPRFQRQMCQLAEVRRNVTLIEGNAKCHLKKLTWKGTLRQVFICLKPRTPYPPPPPHACIPILTQGRGGGAIEPERRLEGQQLTKCVENTNDCVTNL